MVANAIIANAIVANATETEEIQVSKINRKIAAIFRCSTQFRTEKMEAFGLKGGHASYLTQICEHPGISQDQLARRLFINKSNIARQAAFLEEEGYITRKPSDTDKRVLELYPTEKAVRILPQIKEIFRQWDRMLTADLTEEEIEITTNVLAKMKDKAAAWWEET